MAREFELEGKTELSWKDFAMVVMVSSKIVSSEPFPFLCVHPIAYLEGRTFDKDVCGRFYIRRCTSVCMTQT